MSEIQKLMALRSKLIVRRRTLVNHLAATPVEQLTGESIAHIQDAIDAVDRALSDEKNTEPSTEDSRRRVPS